MTSKQQDDIEKISRKEYKEIIEASKDTSLGFVRCAICGCELEITKKFAETVGISSSICIECSNPLDERVITFNSRISYWMKKLKNKELKNMDEVKEKIRKEGYFV